MARNLMHAGYSLTVYNRDPQKAEALVPDGAKVAESPAAACATCNVAITMLADDQAAEEVVFGPQGFADVLPVEAVHISCSTISTAMARKLAAEHAMRRQSYLSAPVFGRPEAAEGKKLLVAAAGPAELIAQYRPLLDALGRETFVIGPEPWQANALKLCGNFMIASMMETFGEAFATLRKAKVDPQIFLSIMNGLFASPIYANYGRIIAEEKFEPAGFALRLGLKDMRLLLETAFECESPMPVASLVRDRLLAAMAQGQAEQDWSALTRVSAREAGL